jgi:elongator complex protein 3
MFEELFQNPDFQPDLLKIYPCGLLKETPLYQYWKKGKYKPYSEKQLINLIINIKKKIPYYVRIQRIARDIPSSRIVTGPARISNLRQILSEKAKKEGWYCRCIRCREIKEKYSPKEKICLFRQDYNASGGKEIFLSFENPSSRTPVHYGAGKNRKLYSLLRLRITPAEKAIIREVHTYGQQVPISESKFAPQHQGLGKKLIKEAEKIAKKEFALNRVAVISGVGARNYFRKLGYKLKDTYMVKNFLN